MADRSEPAPNRPSEAPAAASAPPCASCGASLVGRFCAQCGEKQLEPDRDHSVRWLLQQMLEGFLHLDGKLVRTFAVLVFAPGQLTRAFVEGRRVAYLLPLPLFAVASVVFYLAFPNAYAANIDTMQQCLRRGVFVGNFLGFSFDAHFLAVAERTGESIAIVQARVAERAGQESKVYLGVLVPWLALVLHACLRGTQPRFVLQLVHGLHLFVTFLVLDLAFLLVCKLAGANQIADAEFAPLFAAMWLHTTLGLRSLHRLRTWRAAAIALCVVAALVVGIVAYRQIVTVAVAYWL